MTIKDGLNNMKKAGSVDDNPALFCGRPKVR